MERIITIHVEKLPEGFYLATSDEVQGLVAQGRTIAEAMEIARDVSIWGQSIWGQEYLGSGMQSCN